MGAESGASTKPSGRVVTGADREYQLKAAFLFNFIRYTTWPEQVFEKPEQPIILTIVGDDPFGKEIDDLYRGKRLQGRLIEIRRSGAVPTKADSQVIFASGLEEKQRAQLKALYHEKPVLIVGEQPEMIESAAQCNFYIEEGKVRFEVNIDNLERAQLKISSQLLKLARIVKNKEEG